jgi:LysM repeat protein
VALALTIAGCSPVSDEEMERLRVETEALASELTRLKSESELLDRALTNAYREKDRVVDRLNALTGEGSAETESLDAAEGDVQGDAAADAGATSAPSAGGRPETPSPASPASAQLTPTLSPPPAGPTSSYVVQGGDTLSRIAHERGVSIQAIVAANPKLANREGNMLWEGETLQVPVGSGETAPRRGTPPRREAPSRREAPPLGETTPLGETPTLGETPPST